VGEPKMVGRLLRASFIDNLDEARGAVGSLLGAARSDAWEGLATSTSFHGAVGYLHRAVDDWEHVPAGQQEHLRDLHDRAVLFHIKVLSDLGYLREVLGDAGVPWLVVKGPTLAVPVHGFADLRPYSDLDLVVPPSSLGGALEALEAAGSEVTDRNWTLIGRELKGEVHLKLPSGTALDLHWHLLNDRDRRQAFPIDMAELFESSRVVDVGGVEVRTLGLAHTAAYLAMHAMHSGGHRLIWLKDLHRLLRDGAVDIDVVIDQARRWRAELVLAGAASRVRHAFGSDARLSQIGRVGRRPRVWSMLTTATWRLQPVELQDGSPSLGRTVARSIRPTQTQSLRELLRRGSRHLMEPGARPAGRRGLDDPGSSGFDAGGEAGRRAYLEAVGRADAVLEEG
jgi:hypothetical protein